MEEAFVEYRKFIVGMLRYSDGYECKLPCYALSPSDALRLVRDATWKYDYDEYYIVKELNHE